MGQRVSSPPAPNSGSTTVAQTSSNTNNTNNNNATTNRSVSNLNPFSSFSSSTSNTSTNNTNNNNSASNNLPRTHHHRSHHHRRGNNTSNQRSLQDRPNQTSSSSSSSSNQGGDLSNMSPRTRFRTEMARRGYTTSSSDLFFRLFQIAPSNSSNENNNVNNNTTSPTAANSSSSAAAASGGLSAFRFLSLGGNNSHSNNNNNNNNAIGDLDSDLSSDEDEPHWNHNLNSFATSLPFFFGMRDFKCFVCNKLIPADDVEAHIMMCLTKPRLTYNDDVLTDEKGECIICFEILEKGQTIARLPCLCIYHKHCIDNWLERSQSCPGHPPD